MTYQPTASLGARKPPILVIDDNDDQWFIIRWALLERFSEVEPVWMAKPAQAIIYLETCQEQSLDLPLLILQDLYVPSYEVGLKTLKLLKQPGKLYSEIPVVMLSQFGDAQDIRACYHNGANSYMAKPVSYIQWLEWGASLRTYWWVNAVLPTLNTLDRKRQQTSAVNST